MFCKKVILINFASFTGKHLCHSLFFNKVAGLRSLTLLKKRLWHRCFPVNVAKFLKTPFLQNTSRRLLLTKIDKTEEMLFRTSRKLAKCDTLNLSDSDLKINYATRYKCLGTYVDQTVHLNDYFEKNIQGNVFSSPSPVQTSFKSDKSSFIRLANHDCSVVFIKFYCGLNFTRTRMKKLDSLQRRAFNIINNYCSTKVLRFTL